MSSIKEAVEALFDDEVPVEEALDWHFAPSFRQRVDGTWLDRDEFAAGIVSLRDAVESVGIQVLDEIADAGRYAERHLIELRRHDGEQVRREVYLFAKRDRDGRFVLIEEVALAHRTSNNRDDIRHMRG